MLQIRVNDCCCCGQLILYLEKNGLHEEGLLRVSGRLTRVKVDFTIISVWISVFQCSADMVPFCVESCLWCRNFDIATSQKCFATDAFSNAQPKIDFLALCVGLCVRGGSDVSRNA